MNNIENYKLNIELSLKELNRYGTIDGGGLYSIEYAYGNYITFSPNNGKFIKLSSWYSSKECDYKSSLEDKIKWLEEHNVIYE